MKIIKIKDQYHYFPQYNLIMNNELLPVFTKYSDKKIVKSITPEISKSFLKQKVLELPIIIFEITQDCNLRCKYCVYSGSYHYYRKHTKSSISIDDAKKTLGYIFSLIKKRANKEITIGFYGGEPLLKFNLINDIVAYSKILFEKWKLSFSLTTNFTYLSPKMVDFIISNDFQILVSLDGDKNHHDQKRIFKNGKGTWQKIRDNLILIKSRDDFFFQKNISISAVFSQELCIDDVFDFFTNDELINKNKVNYSTVNIENTDYFRTFRTNNNKMQADMLRIKNLIKSKLRKNEDLVPLEKSFFDLYMNNRKLNLSNSSLFFGACIFNSRLFVDVEGNFHICERLNDTFSIGDAQNGFDYDKMKKIVKDYFKITGTHCIACDYSYLCNPCYARFAGNKSFEINEKTCKEVKNRAILCLRDMVDVGEAKEVEKKKHTTKAIYKFHQFILLKKGPVNTAIIDFLKGNLYQIENSIIEKFLDSSSSNNDAFLQSAIKEELVIKTEYKTWIPSLHNVYFEELGKTYKKFGIILELENGVDQNLIQSEFENIYISEIKIYSEKGQEPKKQYDALSNFARIDYRINDFKKCIKNSCVDQDFFSDDLNEHFYSLNKRYNSCWFKKVAVSKGGEIKPCIYSNINLGILGKKSLNEVFASIKFYWNLTKDQVKICRDCELKYVCFDCREISYRESGDLYEKNPYCKYNPYTGRWS
jgi:uncharacterized protein